MQESSCALWQTGVEQFDELHEIDWDWLSMDGAMSHPPRWKEKRRAEIPPIAANLVSSAVYSPRDVMFPSQWR